MFYFFFFKQKTAYEMRISDWSSDVCSSDLARQEIDRERKAIHFGVERDDEGLNQTRAGPVLPACGRAEVIEQPGRDNDHQNRVGPQLPPFAVATGHRLTSFSVDSRSLLAHRVVGALALLPEPLGALRIGGADARPVCDGAPGRPAVYEHIGKAPG